jgi:predicted dienelactone hydrolase
MRYWAALAWAFLAWGCSESASGAADATPFDGAMEAGPADAQPMMPVADAGPMDAGHPPIRVGYRESTVTYLPRGALTERTLPLSLWYPTHDSEGAFTAYQDIFVRDEVLGGATPAFSGPAPVLLFSHGRCGFGQYSYFLTEHFARAGWLVASVDHVGDLFSACDDTAAIYEQRPQDISAILDHLAALPADDPLADVASEDVALVGHSFGGYTTLVVSGARFDVDSLEASCPDMDGASICADLADSAARLRAGFHDPRVRVAVPMAPGDGGLLRDGINAIDVPTLLMTANFDRNNSDEADGDPIWAALDGPDDRRVRFDRAGHFSFTSLCGFIGPLGENNGCSEESIPPEELHPIINEYVMAFVRLHLFGDESGRPLIDGEVSLREEVTVVRKPGIP